MPNSNITHIVHKPHNHSRCIKAALKQAQALCQANRVRLTPTRKEVLGIIWKSHKPLGAYDIMALLGQPDKIVAPPTVYRALDFLMAQGLIHRIASLNAYIGCSSPETDHLSQFLLCRNCGVALELDAGSISTAIEDNAAHYGFQIVNETVEISGICRPCQKTQ